MTVHTPIPSAMRGVPGWALGLTLVVFLAGGAYFGTNLTGENPPIVGGSPSSPAGPDAHAVIARAGCMVCHAPDLTGQVGPSLHGVKSGPVSPNLQQLAADHPDDWASIWIAGTDPAVSDPAMRVGMPAFAADPYNLTPEEIAAVVAYLKTLQ